MVRDVVINAISKLTVAFAGLSAPAGHGTVRDAGRYFTGFAWRDPFGLP